MAAGVFRYLEDFNCFAFDLQYVLRKLEGRGLCLAVRVYEGRMPCVRVHGSRNSGGLWLLPGEVGESCQVTGAKPFVSVSASWN